MESQDPKSLRIATHQINLLLVGNFFSVKGDKLLIEELEQYFNNKELQKEIYWFVVPNYGRVRLDQVIGIVYVPIEMVIDHDKVMYEFTRSVQNLLKERTESLKRLRDNEEKS